MTTTVAILEAHTDEVWDVQWSHSGAFLASASRDRSAIIWRKVSSPSSPSTTQEWSVHHILRGHTTIERLAWSPTDKVLLTSGYDSISMWDTETGGCIHTVANYNGRVMDTTSICWLPNGSGFVTGSLNKKMIFWNSNGQVADEWDNLPTHIIDFAITPDGTRLVIIGNDRVTVYVDIVNPRSPNGKLTTYQARVSVYNLATKAVEFYMPLEVRMTSIRISSDSQFALINQSSPDEIHLLDLHSHQLQHRYKGQTQQEHTVRSSFGGVDGTLIASGSEDGKIYLWDRSSEVLLESISGHGEGCVSTVTWNPVNDRIFASASDDHTIRIWEMHSSGHDTKEEVDTQGI